MSDSEEYALYQEVLKRAQAECTSNPRTGPLAMFTSSKAYAAVEKLYAADKKAGYKGIYCGPQATGDGYLTGPFMNLSTREMIRKGIWVGEEAEEESNPYFDHGNLLEAYAITLLRMLANAEIVVTGRISCLVPGYTWMAATPDGIMFSRKSKKAYILEVKCPLSRKIETTEAGRTVRLATPFVQPVWAEWEVDENGEGVLSWRDMEFTEVTLFQNSKIPPYYILQMLLECFSAGIMRAVFLQFQQGGPFRVPQVHVTYWDFDQRLWDKMVPYWTECWKYVVHGRELQAQLDELRSRTPEQLTEHDRVMTMTLSEKLEHFPWPKTTGRGKHHIPFEFDK